jgi:hypothetical protein
MHRNLHNIELFTKVSHFGGKFEFLSEPKISFTKNVNPGGIPMKQILS